MSTLVHADACLHDVLQAAAQQYPQRIAVWFEGQSWTFAEFNAESSRLANAFRELGLCRRDRLSVFLPNSPEMELSIYAASKLGAVTCPLNPSYRSFEITHLLNDSGSTVLLTHAKLWPFVKVVQHDLQTVREYIVLGDIERRDSNVHSYQELVARQCADAPEVQVGSDELALLPYSSGTTGKPKGVMLTHRNLISCHAQLAAAGDIGPDDVFMVFLPLAHIYGISALMGLAIYAGAQQVILERFDLDTVVRLVGEMKVTWLHVVPPVLRTLAAASGLTAAQFSTVKYISNAAAPLDIEIAHRVEEKLGVRVIQAYGMTEASPATHHSPLPPGSTNLKSVGVPCRDTEQRVVDLETGEHELGPDEIGELIVRGPQVMLGYWNAPEETSRTLRNGWLYTGDIGWIDRAGYAYITDRKKEMIKFKGFSVAPAELETVLLEHPDIADCAVVGVPDEEAGQVPKGFLVPRAGVELNLEAVSQFVASRVAGYKRIQRWKVVSSIPRTPTGKVLRRSLRQDKLP